MSYKGFKKVSSDKKVTTLIHPQGHQLRIAHGSLSQKLKDELAKLPMHQPKKMAGGGPVKKYADGTPSVQSNDETDNSTSDQPASPVQIYVGGQPAQPAAYQPSLTKDQVQNADKAHLYEPTLDKDRQYYQDQDAANAPPAQPAGQDQGPAPASVPTPQPAQPPPNPAVADMGQSPPGASGAPAPAAPPAPVTPAPEMSPPDAAGQDSDYQNSFSSYKQAHQQEFAQQDAAFQQDLQNGHITPENYHDLLAKKDTLGKIGTIFGVMLGGIGSGLTGQPNAALTAMNNEISNDLQAQVHSKENAQNFLKINQQQQMNEASIANMQKTGQLTAAQTKEALTEANSKAFTLSQMQMNRVALHSQAQKVASMPEGPQKEQAKQALAMMGTAVTNENANIGDIASSKMALLSTLKNGNNGQGLDTTALRMMGMKDLAENQERKTIPGIPGQANIDIPQETRDRITAQQQYDQKAKEYVDFAKQHANNWANLNPTQRQAIANQGGAMGANLQSLYRNKIKGGVYKKGEQEFIQQIVPDNPAKWSASFNAIPKVQQTIADNQSDMQNTAASVGLKMPDQQSGMVSVISPNGQRGSIPAANLQKALSKGYKAAQ